MLADRYQPILNRLFFIFAALMLIALPISKALSNVGEIALVVLSLVQLTRTGFKVNWQSYRWIGILAIFFFMYVIGLGWTENFKYGFKFINAQHRLVAFPLIAIAHAHLFAAHQRSLLGVFVLGNVMASVVTLAFLLLPENFVIELTHKLKFLTTYPVNDHRLKMGLYSPFIDRIQFSSMLGLGILAGVYLIRIGYKKVLMYGLVVIMLVTTLLLGGRGGQLGLFAGLSVYVLYLGLNLLIPRLTQYMSKKIAISMIIVSIFSAIVILPFTLYQTVPAIHERYGIMLKELEEFSNQKGTVDADEYEHKTTVRRIISWQNHWTIIKEHWLLGVGTGDYLDDVQKAYDQDPYSLPVNSHNQYQQIWVSVGLIGLLIFLSAIGYWCYKIYGENDLAIYSLSVMVFYLVSFIPDALLLTQIDVMAFSFFYCFLGVLKNK